MQQIDTKYIYHQEPYFKSALRKLLIACDVDVSLSYSQWITKHTTIDGKPFSWRGYEYLIDVVNDMHPRQYIIKPSQVGVTEIILRKVIAFLMRYALTPFYYFDEDGNEVQKQGINGIYSLPNADDIRDLAKDRILSKIINPVEYLTTASSESTSESLSLIGLYNSFLYLLGRGSEAAVQTIPAEIVVVDEYDQGKVLTNRDMLYARLRNAQVVSNKYYRGLFIGFGTPTLPDDSGQLIDSKFNQSDQKYYHVKCTRCNHWQEVKWPDSCANYYEKGQEKPEKDPFWQCLKCYRPLDFREIGNWSEDEPLKVHNAEWVTKYPERTSDGGGIRGYRIPFANG